MDEIVHRCSNELDQESEYLGEIAPARLCRRSTVAAAFIIFILWRAAVCKRSTVATAFLSRSTASEAHFFDDQCGHRLLVDSFFLVGFMAVFGFLGFNSAAISRFLGFRSVTVVSGCRQLQVQVADENLSEQEDLIVRMQTAALPTIRKLYGKVEVDLQPNETITVTLQNNCNTYNFDGKKKVVLSTTSSLGGKNDFLGIAYLAVVGLCFFLARCFTLVYFIKLRYVKSRNDQQLRSLSGEKRWE